MSGIRINSDRKIADILTLPESFYYSYFADEGEDIIRKYLAMIHDLKLNKASYVEWKYQTIPNEPFRVVNTFHYAYCRAMEASEKGYPDWVLNLDSRTMGLILRKLTPEQAKSMPLSELMDVRGFGPKRVYKISEARACGM